MDASEEIESVLYLAREVSGMSLHSVIMLTSGRTTVYKIPPRRSNEGYRANDWGDLAVPLWKGRLRIIENSKGVALQLEDVQTGEAIQRWISCFKY